MAWSVGPKQLHHHHHPNPHLRHPSLRRPTSCPIDPWSDQTLVWCPYCHRCPSKLAPILYIYIRVERSNPKVKVESASSNPSSTSKTTKANPIPHGPLLPSPKNQVSSSASAKIESNDTSPTPTTTLRTIKAPSNGNDRYESSQIASPSTTREISPPARKETSTGIEK